MEAKHKKQLWARPLVLAFFGAIWAFNILYLSLVIKHTQGSLSSTETFDPQLSFKCYLRHIVYTRNRTNGQKHDGIVFIQKLSQIVVNVCASQVRTPKYAPGFITNSESIGKAVSETSTGWSRRAKGKIFGRAIKSVKKHPHLQN